MRQRRAVRPKDYSDFVMALEAAGAVVEFTKKGHVRVLCKNGWVYGPGTGHPRARVNMQTNIRRAGGLVYRKEAA